MPPMEHGLLSILTFQTMCKSFYGEHGLVQISATLDYANI